MMYILKQPWDLLIYYTIMKLIWVGINLACICAYAVLEWANDIKLHAFLPSTRLTHTNIHFDLMIVFRVNSYWNLWHRVKPKNTTGLVVRKVNSVIIRIVNFSNFPNRFSKWLTVKTHTRVEFKSLLILYEFSLAGVIALYAFVQQTSIQPKTPKPFCIQIGQDSLSLKW